MVNGGPLPPEVIHHPMSSFDENGNYKGYTVIAKATPAPTNEQEAPIPEKDQRMAGSPVKAAETPMPTAPSTVPAEVKASMVQTPYSKAVRNLSLANLEFPKSFFFFFSYCNVSLYNVTIFLLSDSFSFFNWVNSIT